jgi:hypothetical protein
MTKSRATSLRRIVPAVGATAVIALLVAVPATHASAASGSSVVPVYLEGEGNADITAELSSWQDDVAADTDDNVIMDYADNSGDYNARQNFIAGSDDYVISGVPFQPSELAQFPQGAKSVISVPLLPTGLAFLYNPPDGGFSVTKGQPDSNGNTVVVPYGPNEGNTVPYVPGETLSGCPQTGCPPVNVPSTNLAAMVQGDGKIVNGYPIDYWGQPSVLSTWDQTSLDYDPAAGDQFSPLPSLGQPVTFLRQDPDDEAYYLQKFLTSQAPTEWTFPAGEQEGEALPTGIGSPQVVGLAAELESFQGDYNPKSGGPPGGGTIAEVPPSGANLVEQDEDTLAQEVHEGKASSPGSPYAVPEFLGIQSANGDYVTPTPGAVEAGVDAGAAAGEQACSTEDTNSLYAMTNKVPGAYPLSWVDCLYAPSSGLTLAKTDALAGLIRYLVTTGQGYAEPNGDGKLPASYVAQGLAAANTLVADNCPGAGGTVVLTSRPTAYSPDPAGVSALGAVDQCVAKTASGAVTTPAGSTTPATTSSGPSAVSASNGSVFSTGGSDSDFSSGSVLPSTVAGIAANPAPAAAPATSPSAAVNGRLKPVEAAAIAANLPIPLSTSTAQHLDKLSALVVGAALFLIARRVYRHFAGAGQ